MKKVNHRFEILVILELPISSSSQFWLIG